MGAGRRTGLDVGELLAAVENAPPVAAADVVGEMLAKMLGASKLALIEESGEMHPREAVQHLIRAVLNATGGRLKDDATVMCLDGHGGDPRLRTSDSGADR